MKTSCTSFICPVCTLNIEIFLIKNAKLIALNCPDCKSIITIYNGKIIIDDLKNELNNLKTKSDVNSLFSLLNKKTNIQINDKDILDFTIDLNLCNSFEEVMELINK